MRKALATMVDMEEFYVYDLFNNFYAIIEKNFYQLGGNLGRSDDRDYKSMQEEVDRTLGYCNGQRASPNHMPTPEEIKDMNCTRAWEPSLEFLSSKKNFNSNFSQCFSSRMSDWEAQQQPIFGKDFGYLVLGLVIVALFIGVMILYRKFCKNKVHFRKYLHSRGLAINGPSVHRFRLIKEAPRKPNPTIALITVLPTNSNNLLSNSPEDDGSSQRASNRLAIV